MLFSEYVYAQLYHPKEGYFAKHSETQLGTLDRPLPFDQMVGYSEYVEKLAQVYPADKFLTPSEIFRPFYGMTLGRLIRKTMEKEGLKEIEIVEVGCGMGGNASSILEYFRVKAPALYPKIRYHMVDISPVAIEKSRELLTRDHPTLVSFGKITWTNKDIADAEIRSDAPCFVIMMEILDNLKHDKVRMSLDLTQVQEAWIETSADGQSKEVWKPLSGRDRTFLFKKWTQLYAPNGHIDLAKLPGVTLGQRMSTKMRGMVGQGSEVEAYLPSGFLFLLHGLLKNFKQLRLLLSDFSSLPVLRPPPPGVIEVHPPIIQTKLAKADEAKEFGSVLEPPFGSADIFFPTDFPLLQTVLSATQNRKYALEAPQEFFARHAEPSWGTTRSGYNPLKEDFGNTRFIYPDF